MSTNNIQRGDVLDFTAPTGGVTSGTPVLIGSLLVVPVADALEDDVFAAQAIGVFEIAKSTNAFTEGQLAYWDDSNSRVTSTATDNTLVGVAAAAAGTSDATALIRLDGVAR